MEPSCQPQVTWVSMQVPAREGQLQLGMPVDSDCTSSAAADLGTTADIQSQKHRPASRSSCGELEAQRLRRLRARRRAAHAPDPARRVPGRRAPRT